MILIAIDPGKTTGVVCAHAPSLKTLYTLELITLTDVVDTITKLSGSEGYPTTIIIEEFRLRKNKAVQQAGSTIPSAEVIGAIRGWAVGKDNVEIVMQSASAIGTIVPVMLKAFDLWKPTVGKPHARDAARHLIYYCFGIYPKETYAKVKAQMEVEYGG
ncbi:MAG: hypothetical protein PHR07_08045 [Acidaminococcaceae bacterium]|nr:hypothetical protein [Acidaminococcaceae bacterium]